MLRRDGGGNAGPGCIDELHGASRRDVLEHNFQFREASEQRLEHRVDEMRFAIKHIDLGLRRFTVNQQGHTDFFQVGENSVDLLDVRDAGIRMRGRTGWVELDTVNKTGGARAIDLISSRAMGQVQSEKRLEPTACRQRCYDALPIGAGHIGRGDGWFKIRHHDGSAEALCSEADDGLQRRAVAQMHMPVVGPLDAETGHFEGLAAAGQPLRSRSSV